MGFVKVVKNKAYYKRYQTKYRRRREGKTNYRQRRGMVKQDKNKYNAAKYRLVARFTNKRCICQIVYSTIEGDRVMAQANSHELPRYGVKAGFTNYAAAYCTGLLVGRRMLQKVGLDKDFVGVDDEDKIGEEYHIEEEDNERAPFKVLNDIGLASITKGARVFGCLKGAVDSGLHIPHSIKNFPGYTPPEDKGAEAEYDAEEHSARIFGEHVATYMRDLEEEDKEQYERQFAHYIKNDISADDLDDMYTKCHESIRADPSFTKKTKRDVKNQRCGNVIKTDGGNEYTRMQKKSLSERRARVAQLIRNAALRLANAQNDEEEEE